MGQSAGRLNDIHETKFNAGLKVRLSQPGLDYGAAIAVDVLAARLRWDFYNRIKLAGARFQLLARSTTRSATFK